MLGRGRTVRLRFPSGHRRGAGIAGHGAAGRPGRARPLSRFLIIPYLGERLDAYATIGFVLGRTQQLAGFVNVTNLPTRPAPMLARMVTSLSALSGGRIVLGMGAGGLWDRDFRHGGAAGYPPAEAVDAFEEGIALVKMLSGGGSPVTYRGRYYHVDQIEPAPAAAPAVWTGSVGPKSLAATGRVADGWIPGHEADWLSDRYRASRPVIDEAAAAAGRDPDEVRTVFNLPGRIAARRWPRPPATATARWIGGSADQWAAELTGAVLEHGRLGIHALSRRTAVPPTWPR